ncbi:MAG: MFS transporter [Candidatus Lokiarchaeota archaeon]|nr:MFS transporter [Candidatus Lokiarchaeota archaeon]
MDTFTSSQNTLKSSGIASTWPLLLTTAIVSTNFSIIVVNMPFLSTLIWPGDPFHAVEMGGVIAIKTWILALSGILFGTFADRFSRKHQFFFSTVLLGLSYVGNGFIPEGQGNVSYLLLMICQGVAGFAVGARNPLMQSYINDKVEVSHRSQFFGIDMALQQFFMVLGMILSTFIFQWGYWRWLFWGIGFLIIIGGIFIYFFIEEPKRGSKMKHLKGVLTQGTTQYNYRINKQTLKSTMLSRTNIIALVEGISTRMAIGMTLFLIINYMQLEKNIAASSTGIFMSLFGLPGALVGNLAFARLSDRLGRKDLRYRTYLIAFSILFLEGCFALIFFLPLPVLTIDQGLNFRFLMSNTIFWILGILLFGQRMVQGIYWINQSPILQKINLPEAQGKITAWNQFLERIGNGIGPLFAGALLMWTANNFQITALVCILVGLPGTIVWLIANKTITQDVQTIEDILESRASELVSKENEDRII